MSRVVPPSVNVVSSPPVYDDSTSMAAFVNDGLINMLNLSTTSRKHKQIRQAAESVLRAIEEQQTAAASATALSPTNGNNSSSPTSADSISSPPADTDADKYFYPFYLSIGSGQPKLMAAALDTVQKLIAYGYLEGGSIADPNLYPPKKKEVDDNKETKEKESQSQSESKENGSATSNSKSIPSSISSTSRRLISVLIESLYDASMYKDSAVQLQVLKCLLTAVTSVSCQVHDHSLLQAVTSCYQIYLQAADETNRNTAKGSLTQIFSLVFQRMESFATQLKQLEQSAALSAAVKNSTANGGKSHSSDNSKEEEEKSDSHSFTAKSGEKPPPGKRGYCIVCGKPANHYCLQTKDSVCSMECKLINLQRREPKRSIAINVKNKIQAKFQVLQNDAYYLLRALVKLSYKSLPHPPEQTAVDSKILSLTLLLNIMQNAQTTFKTSPTFIHLVKGDLVNCILRNSAASSIESIFALSSNIFVCLVAHFKQHLFKVIGPVLDSIYLPYISNPNSSFDHKYSSLQVLKSICSDANTIVELFLNYDCDIGSFNTFQKIAGTLEKVVQGSYFVNSGESLLSEEEENRLKMLSLEALVECMKSLVVWTKRGESLREKGENDKHDEESNEAGSSSFLRSSTSPSHSLTSLTSPSPPPTTSIDDKDDDIRPGQEDTYVSAGSGLSTSTSFSTQFHALRQQKQKLDSGILKFNMSPKKGLTYLFTHGLLEKTPESVASFFHQTPGLDKVQMGDYMGEDNDFNKKVLYAYVEQLSFRNSAFDEAIRAFLNGFRLPGEAQKIDRMMEKFAEQYHKHNPGVFSSADTAYVLAYSVIMLNTDAHNPGVKNRMTKEEFFKNCRGIDDGKDINPTFLGDIYERITTNEIKMKDDVRSYNTNTGLNKIYVGEVNAKKRIATFMKESQQMVKRTQDLIKSTVTGKNQNNSNNSSNGNRIDDINTTGDSSDSSTNTNSSTNSNNNNSNNEKDKERPFYLVQPSDWIVIAPMFDILWYPSLATFSVLLEENESETVISLCLDGYKHCIRISNALNLETSRLAFVTSLKKLTLLGSGKEMANKNIYAIKMLLSIVNAEGNYLKDSWYEVLTCISEVERLHLIATSNKPTVDIFQSAPPSIAAQLKKETDALNANKLYIDFAFIERVFINSANLNGDAIVDFVSALRRVSIHELDHPTAPRTFSLQKIVEITYYNMGRIRLVWSKIWVILSEFFVKAGTHFNLAVSLYAIDSLRQLAMKFLEKDELANYQFQKAFFRPFELIMQSNPSVEARELIVQCLARMILARKKNIKSGWRGVFVVLAIAAKQSHPSLIQSSADLLSTIIEQHFALITESTETMDECVNCLVAFGCQTLYTDIALQAIHYLTLCATHMAAVPAEGVVSNSTSASGTTNNGMGTPKSVTSEANASIPTNAASSPLTTTDGAAVGGGGAVRKLTGSPIIGPVNPSGQLSAALSSETGELGSTVSLIESQGLNSTSSSLNLTSLPLPLSSQSNLLKVWFLLLTGLSRMIGDSRADVRQLSLTTLYSILNENGQVFSASTWRAIFHGVLLPIFDDVRYTQEKGREEEGGNFLSSNIQTQKYQQNNLNSAPPSSLPSFTSLRNPNISSESSSEIPTWIHTTCYSALSSLVRLFSRFYSTTYFLLPDLLHLLSSCIQQENDSLATIGCDALALLLKESGPSWSVGSAWTVLESISEIVHKTLPVQLLSPKLRSILGLPPISYFSTPPAAPSLRIRTTSMNEEKLNNADFGGNDDTVNTVSSSISSSSSSSSSLPSDDLDERKDVDFSLLASGSEIRKSFPLSSSSSPPVVNTHSSIPTAGSVTVILPFSTTLLHTRCRIQLLLVSCLHDCLISLFPQRVEEPNDFVNTNIQQYMHFRPLTVPPTPSNASRSHTPMQYPIASTSSENATPQAYTSHSRQSSFSASLPIASTSSATGPGSDAAALISSSHTRRDDARIFHHFLSSHLLYLLSIYEGVLNFTRTFNSDVPLRKRLYAAGLILQQTGRLPQLFELEAKVSRLLFEAMFKLWKEGGEYQTELEKEKQPSVNSNQGNYDKSTTKRKDSGSATVTAPEEKLVPLPNAANPSTASTSNSFPLPLNELSSYDVAVSHCHRRLFGLTHRLLVDYNNKTQAGQLVSLEFMDEVIAYICDSYSFLPSQHTATLLANPPLWANLIELVELGSIGVRQSVKRLLKGTGVNVIIKEGIKVVKKERQTKKESSANEPNGISVVPLPADLDSN